MTRAKAVPLAAELAPDAIVWRKVAARTWEYRRGRMEVCRIRGPLPLGVRVGYKSGNRRLRPMVWDWSAFFKRLEIRGGGGCASSLGRAKAQATAELLRARDDEVRWQAYLGERRAAR